MKTSGYALTVVMLISLSVLLVRMHSARSREKAFLAVWESAESTAPQRAAAVNRRFARGTLESAIRSLLGPGDDSGYYHGWGVFDLKHPTSDLSGLRRYAFIRVDYQFSDGRVSLLFEPLSPSNHFDSRFLYASAEVSGFTNDVMKGVPRAAVDAVVSPEQ